MSRRHTTITRSVLRASRRSSLGHWPVQNASSSPTSATSPTANRTAPLLLEVGWPGLGAHGCLDCPGKGHWRSCRHYRRRPAGRAMTDMFHPTTFATFCRVSWRGPSRGFRPIMSAEMASTTGSFPGCCETRKDTGRDRLTGGGPFQGAGSGRGTGMPRSGRRHHPWARCHQQRRGTPVRAGVRQLRQAVRWQPHPRRRPGARAGLHRRVSAEHCRRRCRLDDVPAVHPGSWVAAKSSRPFFEF